MARFDQFGQPILPRGVILSVGNPYEHLATQDQGQSSSMLQASSSAAGPWSGGQQLHVQASSSHVSNGLQYEVGGMENEESDAGEQGAAAEGEVPPEQAQPADPIIQLLAFEGRAHEPEDEAPFFDEEYEPVPMGDGPDADELDPEEGDYVPRINLEALKQRLARLSDSITENGDFVAFLGYRLPQNYSVSDIERLLSEAGCYPKDTHLTEEELKSEPVAAWLREFAIYLPNAPDKLATGKAPSLLGTRAVQVPTRIGYSSPSFTTFISHHLRILMPSHPLYPNPSDGMCELCHEPYDELHPPVLISDAGGCRNHIFGYQCLRKHLSSNTSVSHKCPKCRTRWFRPRRHEMRDVMRNWTEVDRKEDEAVRREEEAFGEGGLGVRARMLLEDGGAFVVDAASLVFGGGGRWVLKKMGYGTE